MTFLTEETPGKVLTLLSASLLSMGFLFAVTITNASLQSSQALPNPFGPSQVMASLDIVSHDYAMFVNQQAQPMEQSLAVASDQFAWIGDNAAQPIVHALGLQPLVAYNNYQAPALTVTNSRVAGAFTERSPQSLSSSASQ